MASNVNFIAAVALLSFGYMAQVASIEKVKQDRIVEMAEIGTIGSKTFYRTANESLTSNWMGAEGLCKYVNMTPAILSNEEEYRFLQDNTQLSTDLWVGATLKGGIYNTREAFEWGDGSAMIIYNFIHEVPLWLCVYFSGDDHLFVDKYQNQHGVMCQKSATATH